MELKDLTTLKTFDPIKPRFTAILDEQTFLKECSFAVQILSKNSYLAQATIKSVLESVLNIAQIGLTLNPVLKLSYLVPRRVGGEVVCVLEPSYQGLCKLATDTGSINNIYSEVVYSNDFFQRTLGTENKINHIPKNSDRGEAIGVYAVARLNDGSYQTEYMDKEEIHEIREYSEAYKSFKAGKTSSCIWDKNEFEMWRKTVIKRLCKYLPKTEKWDKLERAIENDNSDYKIDYWQIDKIESLLKISAMDEEKKSFISRYMNTYTKDQANSVIEQLEAGVMSPITRGDNYNQSDITALKKEHINP